MYFVPLAFIVCVIHSAAVRCAEMGPECKLYITNFANLEALYPSRVPYQTVGSYIS